jgi:hypothetical protein
MMSQLGARKNSGKLESDNVSHQDVEIVHAT